MTAASKNPKHDSAGAWAKRLHFASRALMDATLRPYDLGSTQWYVLYQLANEGPTMQRDLIPLLQIEKATLSGVVQTLVRKGLVDQIPHTEDQRQRMLHLTASGKKLWMTLPDPITLIISIAFDGVSEAELAVTRRVLKAATERLTQHTLERKYA